MKLIKFEGKHKTFYINPEYVASVVSKDSDSTFIMIVGDEKPYIVQESLDTVVAKLLD